jgi:hypothetical protein
MNTTESNAKDALETIIGLVCVTDQECEQLSEKAAQLDIEGRALFNFIFTNEWLSNEWLFLARRDNPEGIEAFMYRAREEMRQKSASA